MRATVIVKVNLLVLGGLVLLLGSSVVSGVIQVGVEGESRVRLALVGAGTSASLFVDPSLAVSLTPAEVGGDDYEKTNQILQRLSDTFGLSDLYILRPRGDDWEFIFDTADGPLDAEAGSDKVFSVYQSPPEEMATAWGSLAPVVTARPYTDEFGTFRSAFVVLTDNDGKPVAVVGADFDLKQLQEVVAGQWLFALALGMGGLALVVLLGWVLARILGRPLQAVSQRFSSLAGGSADLTDRLNVRGHDELADLANGFNGFVDKLRILMADLQSNSRETARIQILLQKEARETSESVGQTRSGAETLSAMGIQLESSMKEVLANLETIVTSKNQLDALAMSQEETTVRAAQDQAILDQAVVELRSQATEVRRVLGDLDQESAHNSRRMDAGLAVLKNLAGAVESVSGIAQTLANTADATGLLAMNASIEAAHAGAEGRGFSVIAQRMRQQAETSRLDADRIGQNLGRMVALIAEAVETVDQTARGALATRQRLGQTLGQVDKLTTASQALESYSQRSQRAMESLRGASRQVAAASGDLGTETLAIHESIQTLQQVSESVLREAEVILEGTRHVSSMVDGISDVAERLARVSRSLEEDLLRFKTA